MATTIKCDKCGNVIEIDEAIKKELQEKVFLETETKHKEEIEKVRNEVLLSASKEANEKAEKQFDQKIKTAKEELEKKDKELFSIKEEKNKLEIEKGQFAEEKKKIEENALKKAEDKLKSELGDSEKEKQELKESLAEKDKKLEEARGAEIKIRKEKNQLEEDKKAFELEKQRQLDEEREKIKEETRNIYVEEHRLKDAETSKKLRDALEANENLKKKLEQGSQQMQGEVLELDIEDSLKTAFPFDEIEPVAKGIRGADVIQKVNTKFGQFAGSIIWEFKRTQAWSDGWIKKLKDDLRSAKGNIGIIVTENLPKGIANLCTKEGIYVVNPISSMSVGSMMRERILAVANALTLQEGRSEKKDVMYDYLCGSEFAGRVGAIVEATISAKATLDKERRSYTKLWAEREKNIDQIEKNMIGMYGDVKGIAGPSLPEIKSLMLTSGEEELESIVDEFKGNLKPKESINKKPAKDQEQLF